MATAAQLFVNPGEPTTSTRCRRARRLVPGRRWTRLSTDLLGNPRPSGNGYDIGAYEYQAGFTVPMVTAETPASSALDVPTTTAVTATFDEVRPVRDHLIPARGPEQRQCAGDGDLQRHERHGDVNTIVGAGRRRDLHGDRERELTMRRGTPCRGHSRWSFTTLALPRVTAETPSSGAASVRAGTTTVSATFNEAVQAGTISFALVNSNNVSVPATVVYSAGTLTATLTPSASLAAGMTYTATVSSAKDASGATMAAPFSWSFTTDAAPTVSANTPAAGATGMAMTTSVTATFDEGIQFFNPGVRARRPQQRDRAGHGHLQRHDV